MDASTLGLGKLITGDQVRDAVHIAVAPVTAADTLMPGQHVGLDSDGRAGASDKPIGCVDPYLRTPVREGQRCWLFLYPGSITALRHEWSHPAFGAEAITPAVWSRRWIEAFAGELDQAYNRLMAAAELWVSDQDYTYDNSETYKDVDDAKWPEFWRHYEIVTGQPAKRSGDHFFTCRC